jgi:Predicted hydrolases or acyltransferases (alpha/beta hydrolase superfamily)
MNMVCNVKNVNIYYEIYGEGTPILMLHGSGPDHRLMKGCMEPVFQSVDRNWKRIYFDLPGMGKTKGEEWICGCDTLLELIYDFVEAVIPNQHYVLAGESFGGYLARGMIYQKPSVVDGLLLICPAVGGEVAKFQVLEQDDAFLNTLSEEDRKAFEAEGINSIRNERVWNRYKEEVLPALQLADYAYMKKSHGGFSFHEDELEKPFEKPTLMLAGRQDSIVGYQGLWNILPNYPRASFVLLDKAAHALQVEQDVLFTETVKEWLNRVSFELD